MFEHDTFSGTIMDHDNPEIYFELVQGKLKTIKYLVQNKLSLPIEFQVNSNEAVALMLFLDYRIVPETRQNIDALLTAMGIPYYHPIEILRCTHGVLTDDYFWVKFVGEDINWAQVKVRD